MAQVRADQEKQNEAKSRSFVTGLVRKYLVGLIVDIMVEFWRRTRQDPGFNQRLSDAFAKLDAANSQEDDDAAAKAVQDAISS